MPGANLTTVLARLLADPVLRARFIQDPVVTTRALGLDDAGVAALSAVDPAALELQAQGLIDKRCHEVRKLLPATWACLGAAALQDAFTEYAPGYWPTGHHRHLDDALHFAQALLARAPNRVTQAEMNRVKFHRGGARWALHWINASTWRALPRAQLLYRRATGAVREFTLSLGR